MATFVDSHVHLADPAFDSDRNAVIERARAIAAEHPGFVHFTAGIHPHDAATFDAARDLGAIRSAVAAGAVAIGECGLDYHYDNSPRPRQLEAFEGQMALAAELGRPLVVHTRSAADDTRSLVSQAASLGVSGVLHCFTGPRELAETALDAGWYLSFSGVITFRKWTDDALLRLAPVDRVLVESDAPFLAPDPHRGKRNEPAWVSLTLARLASARGVPADVLGAATSENAARLFGVTDHV